MSLEWGKGLSFGQALAGPQVPRSAIEDDRFLEPQNSGHRAPHRDYRQIPACVIHIPQKRAGQVCIPKTNIEVQLSGQSSVSEECIGFQREK